jgi:hypothetical protein
MGMKEMLMSLATVGLLWNGLQAELSSAPAERLKYYGMCDASAVEALDDEFFIVGDDEDNILRVYSRLHGGLPVQTFNLSPFLGLGRKKGEVDLEAASRIGDRVYWITSHGANSSGEFDPHRHRFFATTVKMANGKVSIQPVGKAYSGLFQDLSRDPRLAKFGLTPGGYREPKSVGGLNIEGLAATADGKLLIGFRNPIPQGRALVVPLENPAEVVEGKTARFGEPILLDLDGLGIRSMDWQNGRYLLVAGSFNGEGTSQLYEWHGGTDKPRRLERTELVGLNPESITFFQVEGTDRLWVVSDDGTMKVAGVDCKKLKNQNQKFYRATSLVLEED